MSNEWVDVATETDLWVRAGISAVMKGTDIALFRIGDAHCAIDNLCTHGQARLCDGFVEGFEVECPLHQGRFDVGTGVPTCERASEAVETYLVRIEGGRVSLVPSPSGRGWG